VSTLTAIAFTSIMVSAMLSDTLDRRIPNSLTYAGLALGLALRIPLGPLEMLLGVAGALIAFGVSLPLFALGGIGGGDVKLLTVVGAFMGPFGLLASLVLAGALGAVVAVVWASAAGVILPALLRTRDLAHYLLTRGQRGALPQPTGQATLSVPYGIAIAGGALIAWFVPLRELIS
jgi:prepilin peptidase CpaA